MTRPSEVRTSRHAVASALVLVLALLAVVLVVLVAKGAWLAVVALVLGVGAVLVVGGRG